MRKCSVVTCTIAAAVVMYACIQIYSASLDLTVSLEHHVSHRSSANPETLRFVPVKQSINPEREYNASTTKEPSSSIRNASKLKGYVEVDTRVLEDETLLSFEFPSPEVLLHAPRGRT